MLQARLTVEPSRSARPEELRAEAILTNVGDEPEAIRPALLASPSLALEITGRSGEPVPLPPPPVPGLEGANIRLAAGEEHRVVFASFAPAWLEPGAYRVRLRYRPSAHEPVVSDWVAFEVG